jgi:protein TonB
MKVFYLATFLCICSFVSVAQSTDTKIVPKDTIYGLPEKESEFPGGEAGWIRFLNAHLEYPQKAVRKNVQGMVIVQFIVNTDGTVSEIEAISGPVLLRDAAVQVLKQSPKWKPGMQLGKKVRTYKKQPITFKLVRG